MIAVDGADTTLWPADTTPAGQLDLEALETLHQDQAGYIALMRKPPGEDRLRPVQSVRVRDLRSMLPGFVEQLLKDGYGSVNAMQAPRRGRRGMHYRGVDMLKSLGSCYADCDFYKIPGLDTFEKFYTLLMAMVASDYIPWPSIVARSGRGAYVFFLFTKPTASTPESRRLYSQVQERFNKILARLGADPRAKDAARVLRLPGSYHTKADRRVQYVVTFNPDGELAAYTLEGLAETVSLPILADEQELRLPVIGSRPEAARAGPSLPAGELTPDNLPRPKCPGEHVARARILDIAKIAEARGGIAEGSRHFFLRWYACSLARMGISGGPLYAWVSSFNERACRPRQPARNVYQACEGACKPSKDNGEIRQVRGTTIAADLQVSPQEARKLGLVSILPAEERDRRELEHIHQIKKHQQDRRDKRRRLRGIYREHKVRGLRLPSRFVLAAEIGCSHQTVVNWLRDMHLRPNKRGRPKRI